MHRRLLRGDRGDEKICMIKVYSPVFGESVWVALTDQGTIAVGQQVSMSIVFKLSS